MLFADRISAGKKLARELLEKAPELFAQRGRLPQRHRKGGISPADFKSAVVILALPRGGVPVAFEIAKKMRAPMDLIITRKLGAPGNPELAIGAVAEDGSVFLDPSAEGYASQSYIKEETHRQLCEIKQRIKKYRGGKPLSSLKEKTVILADDGIATGSTMRAAILLARSAGAARIIVATPVLPPDTLNTLQKEVQVVFLETPSPFLAIGRFYEDFSQLTDEEVQDYLKNAQK